MSITKIANYIERRLSYQFCILKSNVLYGSISIPFIRIRAWIRFRFIMLKLQRKGYDELRVATVLLRLMNYIAYINQKRLKQSRSNLMQTIVKISESSGAPQWQLRTRIQRDFHVDI